jgi:hypothetical protein
LPSAPRRANVWAFVHDLAQTPPQVDGEPWLQPAAQLEVDFRGTALMLRRLESAPLARMAAGVTEALEACQVRCVRPPADNIPDRVLRQY